MDLRLQSLSIELKIQVGVKLVGHAGFEPENIECELCAIALLTALYF